MQVLIKVNDAYRPSITAERLAYNATLPATVTADANGNALPPGQTLPNPDIFTTDEAFVQYLNGKTFQDLLAKHGVLPKPVVVDGVPQEVSARQAYQELIAQGLHNDDPTLSAVEKCIDQIVDPLQRSLTRQLFRKSQIFERQRPELVQLWMGPAPAGLGKTAAQLDQTFVNADARP